jgi:hypothetical protein
MYTICCTSKVLKRTGFPTESSIIEPTTALGNWYVNILFFHRRQILLFVSDRSRLAVVTPAKETRSLAVHLSSHLSPLLRRLRAEPEWIEAEIHQMKEVIYAKTRNRSILGTMSEFKIQIEAILEDVADMDSLEIALTLCDVLMGPPPYRYPKEVAIDLLREKYGTG